MRQGTRQVDTILARFPGPVTLTPSRLKMLAWFAFHLGMTVFSVFLLLRAIDDWSSEIIYASGAIVVFGALTIVFAVVLLTGAARLTLDTQGFEIGYAFGRRTRARWENVSNFHVRVSDDAAKAREIAFEVTPPGAVERDVLPDNYQLPKDDLAWLMGEWRERALALPRRPTSVPRVGPVNRT